MHVRWRRRRVHVDESSLALVRARLHLLALGLAALAVARRPPAAPMPRRRSGSPPPTRSSPSTPARRRRRPRSWPSPACSRPRTRSPSTSARRPARSTSSGSSSRLYVLNPVTGVAVAVGGPFTPALSGAAFGFDFNPTVDRIRVVSDTGQNLRLNPDTGAVAAVDTALNPGAPNVVGSAYSNNVAGATTTTLYAIDSTTDQLFVQNPPNAGVLVAGRRRSAWTRPTPSASTSAPTTTAPTPSLTVGGTSVLITINLTTGAAAPVGAMAGGPYRGLDGPVARRADGRAARQRADSLPQRLARHHPRHRDDHRPAARRAARRHRHAPGRRPALWRRQHQPPATC